MAAGAAVKLLSSYILIGTRGIEMYGAPIGTFLCYLTTMLLNFFFVAIKIGYKPNVLKLFVKPLIAAALCAGAAFGTNKLLAGAMSLNIKVSAILAVGVAVVVYVVAIFALKALSEDDVMLLPKGKKICSVLKRHNLI